MKKLILFVGVFLSTAVAAQGLQLRADCSVNLGQVLEQALVQAVQEELPPYYKNEEVASLCRAWNSCSVWALSQHKKDPTFYIKQAKLKTQRNTYRHRVTKDTYLYVQATLYGKVINVLFTSPQASKRTQSYRYIRSFPAD